MVDKSKFAEYIRGRLKIPYENITFISLSIMMFRMNPVDPVELIK